MKLKPNQLVRVIRPIFGRDVGYPEYGLLHDPGQIGKILDEGHYDDSCTSIEILNAFGSPIEWSISVDFIEPVDPILAARLEQLPRRMGKKTKPYRDRWQVGMAVTTKRTVEAYYSGYGIKPYTRPFQAFIPGMVGLIAAVEVARVSRKYISGSRPREYLDDGPYFVCVDFIGTDGKKWRVGMNYSDLEVAELWL